MVYRSLGFRECGLSGEGPPFSSLAPEIAGRVIRELQMIGVPTEVRFIVNPKKVGNRIKDSKQTDNASSASTSRMASATAGGISCSFFGFSML